MSNTGNEINKDLVQMTREERVAKEESVTPRTVEQRLKALEAKYADSEANNKSLWSAINELRSAKSSKPAVTETKPVEEGG